MCKTYEKLCVVKQCRKDWDDRTRRGSIISGMLSYVNLVCSTVTGKWGLFTNSPNFEDYFEKVSVVKVQHLCKIKQTWKFDVDNYEIVCKIL